MRSRNESWNERINKNYKDGYNTAKRPSFTHRKFTKANLRELLAEINSETYVSEQNNEYIAEDKADSESKFLVNATSANAINPGDILELMHAPRKGKCVPKRNQTALSNEVTMNVKTNREVNQHSTYCVTKSSHFSLHSLVDRGANGRVSGSDARAIVTRPNRNVDIREIENHEIASITLVTAGGVTSTISSKVAVIMHQ